MNSAGHRGIAKTDRITYPLNHHHHHHHRHHKEKKDKRDILTHTNIQDSSSSNNRVLKSIPVSSSRINQEKVVVKQKHSNRVNRKKDEFVKKNPIVVSNRTTTLDKAVKKEEAPLSSSTAAPITRQPSVQSRTTAPAPAPAPPVVSSQKKETLLVPLPSVKPIQEVQVKKRVESKARPLIRDTSDIPKYIEIPTILLEESQPQTLSDSSKLKALPRKSPSSDQVQPQVQTVQVIPNSFEEVEVQLPIAVPNCSAYNSTFFRSSALSPPRPFKVTQSQSARAVTSTSIAAAKATATATATVVPVPTKSIPTSTPAPTKHIQEIPELQYSGSFNSKSSIKSKSISIQDCYSEEHRLYRSSSSEKNIPNSAATATATATATASNLKDVQESVYTKSQRSKNQFHHRSHTVPAISIQSSKWNTKLNTSLTFPLGHPYQYTHKSVSSKSNSSMNRKAHSTISPHSNLGDLISASKKMQHSQQQQQQQQQQHQPGLLGTSPSGLSSSNMYLSQQQHLQRQQQQQQQQQHLRNNSAASGATGTTIHTNGTHSKITRPGNLSMASKSKSTGMLLSHPSIGSSSPPPFDFTPQTGVSQTQTIPTLFQYPPSISPPKIFTPQAQPPLSMNPFEDPKLIGDLNKIQNININVNSSHVGGIGSAGVVVKDDPFAQFDPLSASQSSSFQLQQHLPPPPQPPVMNSSTNGHQPSPSIDTAQLSELAAALSSLKPQQPNNNDINNIDTNNSNNNNGNNATTTIRVSLRDSQTKSHRRFLSLRGAKSMNQDDMKNVMDNMNLYSNGDSSGGEGDTNNNSSSRKKDKKDKRFHHKRAASTGILTRPKSPVKGFNVYSNNNGNEQQEEDGNGNNRAGKSPSRRKLGLLRGKSHSRNNSSSAVTPNHSPSKMRNPSQLETINSNESPDAFHRGGGIMNSESTATSPQNTTAEIKIRSSEHDPSPHQIKLPQVSDVLMQARLCRLMERYREIDRNFDFNVLANVSRQDMQLFVDNSGTGTNSGSPTRQLSNAAAVSAAAAASTNMQVSPSTMMQTPIPTLSPTSTSPLLNLVKRHRPIVETILSSANDLVLSAFYYGVDKYEKSDSTQDASPGVRKEVAIFASDELRQFIVVYQGSAENQLKPIRNRFGKFKSKPFKNFGNEKNLTVFPPFQQGYNQSGLEEKVFQKLDELAEQHPFFDVIVTGHSYGATLALLGGMRYACSRPAMMVSCYAFGCPKVGAMDFRHYVNSLPNLKVMRLEYGFDKWVHAPDNPTWTHVGHTISILPQHQQRDRKNSGGNEKLAKEHAVSQGEFLIRAYKFENDRPDSSNGKFIGKKGNKQENKIDHDISSYLNAIEVVAKEGVSWPRQFVGEEGTGVRGLNKEKRLVC